MDTVQLFKMGSIIWKCPDCDTIHDDFIGVRNGSIVFECSACRKVFIQEDKKHELKLINPDKIKETIYFFWECPDCDWSNNVFKQEDEMTCQKCGTKFKMEKYND